MRLAVGLVMTLVATLFAAGPTRADGPSPSSQLPDEPINVPAVPEPSCQCEDGGPWVPCTQCGGGGGSSSGDPSNRTQRTPPILKLAAGVVVGAAVAALFAVAPGNTTALFTKTQTAREASDAWHDERERIAALELVGKRSTLFTRELNVSLQASARPVGERVGAGYAPVEVSSPPPDRWAANGACSQVLVAHDRELENFDRRATEKALSQFPTAASLIEAATTKVKQEALAVIARATGTQKLLKQGKALLKKRDEAKAWAAFYQEIDTCLDRQLVEPETNCMMLIVAKVNAEQRAVLDELQAGAGDAHERVREAASFLRGYVIDVQRAVEKHAMLGLRECQ